MLPEEKKVSRFLQILLREVVQQSVKISEEYKKYTKLPNNTLINFLLGE